jgi:alcohol dehydrogenase (cytochrome c)
LHRIVDSSLQLSVRVLVLCLLLAASMRAQKLDGSTRADWPHYGGTLSAWRYSALDQINTSNVRRLTPAWVFQTGDASDGLQSTPLVIDGVLYLITPHTQVFAIDAATGSLRWQYKPPTPRPGRAGGQVYPLNRGVAIAQGKVFFGSNDNFLVALDQKSGREAWRVAVDDVRQCGCNITGAPLIAGDKVIVGGTGGDAAHRGYLTAFYATNGQLAWRWYVIPGPGEKGHETWKGDSWKFGGGAPWMTGSYDPVLNLVYWGTGNASGDFNDADRNPGSDKGADRNLYTASVVALDAATGKLRWYRQEVPGDLWDFDSAYEVILFDAPVRGQERKLLAHMNKSGLTLVLDRTNGEIVKAFSVPEVKTWISGVTEDGKLVGRVEPEIGKAISVCPSVGGAKSWNSMAYSPRTGFIYVPVIEMCNAITANPQPAQEGSFRSNGGMTLRLPAGRSTYGHVDAWDPLTGRRVWSVPSKYPLMASMLATAGDLVFTGDPEGNFFALDARSGGKLWNYQTGAGHRGSAISYSVNGRQYIATPTGWQSSITGGFVAGMFPDQTFRTGSTLIMFSLPEAGK